MIDNTVDDLIEIGPFKTGEIPPALAYTFEGVDLTGYDAVFIYQLQGGVGVERIANVTDAANGEVTYNWDPADLEDPGVVSAEVWAGNGTNRFASPTIRYTIRPSVADTPPNI
jgi:hypothetical protein